LRPTSEDGAVTNSPWRTRLAQLSDEHDLPADAAGRLAHLLELVRDDPTAPTTVVDPALAVDAHVADSLAALRLPALRHARRIADIGAGAGFPGLALAVALPDAHVFLVESQSRKCAFLERAVEAVETANASVACTRVEEWPERELDVVTVRAVAPLAVLVEYAAPLLRLGGTLVAWKGQPDADEEAAGARAAEAIGLKVGETIAVAPFPGADRRSLYLYSKALETPAKFPRRPGMARKRPLSG
jgi:16S rRNA (guanine527-N7)-methyltransferase